MWWLMLLCVWCCYWWICCFCDGVVLNGIGLWRFGWLCWFVWMVGLMWSLMNLMCWLRCCGYGMMLVLVLLVWCGWCFGCLKLRLKMRRCLWVCCGGWSFYCSWCRILVCWFLLSRYGMMMVVCVVGWIGCRSCCWLNWVGFFGFFLSLFWCCVLCVCLGLSLMLMVFIDFCWVWLWCLMRLGLVCCCCFGGIVVVSWVWFCLYIFWLMVWWVRLVSLVVSSLLSFVGSWLWVMICLVRRRLWCWLKLSFCWFGCVVSGWCLILNSCVVGWSFWSVS